MTEQEKKTIRSKLTNTSFTITPAGRDTVRALKAKLKLSSQAEVWHEAIRLLAEREGLDYDKPQTRSDLQDWINE